MSPVPEQRLFIYLIKFTFKKRNYTLFYNRSQYCLEFCHNRLKIVQLNFLRFNLMLIINCFSTLASPLHL